MLGHDECGAVRATMDATEGKMMATGEFIHNLVERLAPTVTEAQANGFTEIDQITDLHIRDTINEMIARSQLIKDRIENGSLAVVGANYRLALGEIHPLVTIGNIE